MKIYKNNIHNKYLMGMCLTRESQNFLSLDIENTSKYKLNVVWFIGDWGYNGEKLYIRYGHLGFYLDGGNIYGFTPNNIKNNNDIFNGQYYGVIGIDNNIFKEAIKHGICVKKIEANITEDVYNQINSWDNKNIDYAQINNILYGIKWNKDFELGIKDKNLLKLDYANCVSFLKYLNPILKKNKKLAGYEILSKFDRDFTDYSKKYT